MLSESCLSMVAFCSFLPPWMLQTQRLLSTFRIKRTLHTQGARSYRVTLHGIEAQVTSCLLQELEETWDISVMSLQYGVEDTCGEGMPISRCGFRSPSISTS